MTLIFLFILISTVVTIVWDNFEECVADIKNGLPTDAAFLSMYVPSLAEDQGQDTSYMTIEELRKMNSAQGEQIDSWLENGTDEKYYDYCDNLKSLMGQLKITDIFIYKAERDENGELLNDMVIVLDLPVSTETSFQLGQHFGATKAFKTVKKVYETGEATIYDESAAYNDSGFIILAFAPIYYSDGSVCAVLGTEVSMSIILEQVISGNIFVLMNTAINFWLFGIIILIFIRKIIVKPVGILSNHMREFVSDEGTLTFTPVTEIHTKDEIEQIADDYNALAERIVNYTKNLAVKTSEEERLRVDLDVASQIRSVVSTEPTYPAFPERSDLDLCESLKHTVYNKCSFCNYFFTDNNRLFMVIGESLGNNLASMIFSILAISHIKSFAKMGFDPYKIAVETNNQLCSTEKTDRGLTVAAIIADVDLKTGAMRYVNAGMPPMLIKRPGENFGLDKADLSFSLGQMRGVTFEQKTLQLYQGSTVLMTSFGVSEMVDEKGQKYGFDRLIEVVNRTSGNAFDLNETVREIDKALDDFRGEAPITIDTAVLGFRYFG
ncbi:MAG: SpoIIE family protein phosphatase [Ruminiclostridium sp.]|nr:SpoIIE family protein phosphatase [Ruminiclostridium sp.]